MTSARKFTIAERGSDLVETPCSDMTFHFHASGIFKLGHKNEGSEVVHTVCMWSLMWRPAKSRAKRLSPFPLEMSLPTQGERKLQEIEMNRFISLK